MPIVLDDKERENLDKHEVYTQLQVKRAQLIWAYKEALKKLETMKTSIIKTKAQLKEIAEKYRAAFVEKIVENDDGQMERFLNGEEIPVDDGVMFTVDSYSKHQQVASEPEVKKEYFEDVKPTETPIREEDNDFWRSHVIEDESEEDESKKKF